MYWSLLGMMTHTLLQQLTLDEVKTCIRVTAVEMKSGGW